MIFYCVIFVVRENLEELEIEVKSSIECKYVMFLIDFVVFYLSLDGRIKWFFNRRLCFKRRNE